tara:strand:+ start:56 stop:697 length:642 start_codon:yes stop_codon:yes gene_type:complete
MAATVKFLWKNIVIGADLDAVNFAHKNNYFLIKNRAPYHHSYENVEEDWANKCYRLYQLGLCPFTDKVKNIRVDPDKKSLKVTTQETLFSVEYENIHIFDTKNVLGISAKEETKVYRVLDWFDCQGLGSLGFDEIKTKDNFVKTVKFFKTLRVDGAQRYLDLMCESFLTEEQLKSFDYSDTMARFKVADLLKNNGALNPKMVLWKRDIYPLYK